MHTKTVVIIAMLCGGLPLSAASAMTIAAPHGVATASTALQVVDYKNNKMNRKVYHKRRHSYTPGNRYNSAPKNWRHHYDRRPGDWRTRGCVIVGPVWWCP